MLCSARNETFLQGHTGQIKFAYIPLDGDQPGGRDFENNHDLLPPPPPPPKIISVYPPFLTDSTPAVKPAPLQSQGSRHIDAIFDPAEAELSSLPPIETSHHLHHHVHKNASLTTKTLRGSHFRGFEDDDSISDEGKKKLANVSDEVILEKAIIAQWPPADQGNRDKHIAPYGTNFNYAKFVNCDKLSDFGGFLTT